MSDDMKCSGIFEITLTDLSGNVIERRRIKNQLMASVQTQRDRSLHFLYNITTSWGIAYFALGTGTTAVTVNDTQLENEGYRQTVASNEIVETGKVRTATQIGETFANGTWTEIGVFCGNTATDDANTGKLLSRIILDPPLVKNTNIILTIIRYDLTTI